MKKIKTVSIITILITLLLNINVFADEKIYTEGALNYVIRDNKVTIIDYFGDDKIVKVPMNMGEYYVTEIAAGTFKDSSVEEVQLPDTIEKVDSEAFNNIKDIDISYFDRNNNDIEIDRDPIVYPEKPIEEEKEKNNNDEKNTTDNEIQSVNFSENIVEFEEENQNESTINYETSSTIIENDTNNANEHNTIGEHSVIKTSLNIYGYILIAATLIILIEMVLIIKRKIRKNKLKK